MKAYFPQNRWFFGWNFSFTVKRHFTSQQRGLFWFWNLSATLSLMQNISGQYDCSRWGFLRKVLQIIIDTGSWIYLLNFCFQYFRWKCKNWASKSQFVKELNILDLIYVMSHPKFHRKVDFMYKMKFWK